MSRGLSSCTWWGEGDAGPIHHQATRSPGVCVLSGDAAPTWLMVFGPWAVPALPAWPPVQAQGLLGAHGAGGMWPWPAAFRRLFQVWPSSALECSLLSLLPASSWLSHARGRARCPLLPPAPSWFRQGHGPLSAGRCGPEEPPLPLSACALAPRTTPFPGLDQFVLDMIFTASVLGLRGCLHFNGALSTPCAALGRGAPQWGPVWGGSSQDQKGCFMAQTCSSGARPRISIWQPLNLFWFLTSSRDRHICLPNLRKEFNSVYFKNLAQS